MKKDLVRLSASRVKALGDCSWKYWCKYHLKLPDTSNSGAMRGSVVHDLFELFTKPKWIHYAYELKDSKCDFDQFPLILRFLRAKCNQYGLEMFEEDKASGKSNIVLIKEMICVGLEWGFFPQDGQKIIDSEYMFDMIDGELKYRIMGFIDRILYDENHQTILVSDYKSSKKQFSNSELETNIQAMMYYLATSSLSKAGKLPDFKKIIIRFIFLRFSENPYQDLEFSHEQIEGFRHYLSYISGIISSFTEDDAKSDYAAYDRARKWQCETKSGWKCPFKDKFAYYHLVDDGGNVVRSAFENEYVSKEQYAETKDGLKWIRKQYDGCPAHNFINDPNDNFDF